MPLLSLALLPLALLPPPQLPVSSARRSALTTAAAAAAAALSPATPAFAARKTAEDVAFSNLLPEDKSLGVWSYGEKAPCLTTSLACLNVKDRQRTSLKDFGAEGKYVVLWFFSEDALAAGSNEKEALGFQKLVGEFNDLDAVVLGYTAAPLSQTQKLVDAKLLTLPFVSDPKFELIDAYGARNRLPGGTLRQTFVLDPTGAIRWIEKTIEGPLAVGNFNLDNHPTRVRRELYEIRNLDGWEV